MNYSRPTMSPKANSIAGLRARDVAGRFQPGNVPLAISGWERVVLTAASAPAANPRFFPAFLAADNRAQNFWETVSYLTLWQFRGNVVVFMERGTKGAGPPNPKGKGQIVILKSSDRGIS